MIDTQRLIQKAAAYGIDAAHCAAALDVYARELAAYNEKVNLTAITAPEAIEDRHFIDSLLLAAQPQVRGSLVDVGTGAGFPGLVARLYNPALSLTLMEPTGKKMAFLRQICQILGLDDVQFAQQRAEEAGRGAWREAFDAATARGVTRLPALAEYCLPLVKVGGWFIAMKGPSAGEEAAAAAPAVARLGGRYAGEKEFALPDGSARVLLFYEKISHTPAQFPRNGGKIAKNPLG